MYLSMQIIEFFPLFLFVFYIRLVDLHAPQDWVPPFLLSGSLAVIVTVYCLATRRILNRPILGINIYFFTGALAFISHQWWLNDIYGQLHASGLLVWMVAVGVVSTLLSRHGFICIKTETKKLNQKYSLMLLVAAVVALIISFFNLGNNRFLAEVIPFILLFVSHDVLRKRLIGNQGT